jgi:hypothetical protein
MNKRGQFNFVWLFAIIAGGAILFLAIYGAVRTGDTYRYQSDTEVAKSISIITDPLQAGFSEGSYGKITFQQETQINNICLDGGLGKNDISVSTRSNIGEEWNLAGGANSIHNKYIFSKERGQGLEYYVFSKPFEFPYKISDLIFMTSDSYCFINAPEEMANELIGLNIENIQVENCTIPNAINVCFGSGVDCDTIVYGSCSSGCDSLYDIGTVSKSNGDMKYVGNLIYGAIFSDKSVYDCNVKRLLYRNGEIANVFADKVEFMDARGCNSNLRTELMVWKEMVSGSTSNDLFSLKSMADNLEDKNDRELCGVW